MSLILNQKLEMFKPSEEGMWKAELGQRLGLMRQMVTQVMNAKEKFLKKNYKCYSSEHLNDKKVKQPSC